jgi:hypothetical protein
MTAGKGSGRRPAAISDSQYQERWDAIFARNVDTSEKRVQESDEIEHDPAKIRQAFEEDADDPK